MARPPLVWLAAVMLWLAAPVAWAHPAPAGGPSIDEVLLERGPCFGECPAYRITLRREGSATYEGLAHAVRSGLHDAPLPVSRFERLVRLLESQGFFALRPEYRRPFVTDQVRITLAVRRGQVWTRVVESGGFGPGGLFGLQLAVEGLAAELKWHMRGRLAPPGPTANELLRSIQAGRAAAAQPALQPDPALEREARASLLRTGRGSAWYTYEPALSIVRRIHACGLLDPREVLRHQDALLVSSAGTIGMATQSSPTDGTWCVAILLGPPLRVGPRPSR